MLSANSNLIGAAAPAGYTSPTSKALGSRIVEASFQFRNVVHSANMLRAGSRAQKAWASACCEKAWHLNVAIEQLRARPNHSRLDRSTRMRIEAVVSEARGLLGAMPSLRNYIYLLDRQSRAASEASTSVHKFEPIESSAPGHTPAAPVILPSLVRPAPPSNFAAPITPPYDQLGLLPVAIRHTDQKIRFNWFRSFYAGQGFGQVRLSTLVTQAGLLTITPAFTYGSFGKIHYGIDSEQQVHIVKEWHLGAMTSRPVGAKVYTCSRAEAVSEIERTVVLRRVIDQTNSMHDLAEPSLLKRVRRGSTVFNLRSCDSASYTDGATGVYKERLFAVMTRDAGSLYNLDYHLSPSLRPAAALSVAVQGYVELEALHTRAQYGHFDISLGNIFYNALGQFKLMDFGMAYRLDKGFSNLRGMVGSVATPEMVLMPADEHRLQLLTAGVDVFALAVLVVNLSCGLHFFYNPFRMPATQENLTFAQQREKLATVFEAFEVWKNDCRSGDMLLVQPEAILKRSKDQDRFTRLFAPMANSCPSLCSLLLNRALVADPLTRAPSSELAANILSMLPASNIDEMNHLQSVMYHAEQRVHYVEPPSKQADPAAYRPMAKPIGLPELAARAGHFVATMDLHLSQTSAV